MHKLSQSKKKAMLASLDELAERMPSLLDVDHPCAQRQIAEARHTVEVKNENETFMLLKLSITCLLFAFTARRVKTYYMRVSKLYPRLRNICYSLCWKLIVTLGFGTF